VAREGEMRIGTCGRVVGVPRGRGRGTRPWASRRVWIVLEMASRMGVS
jgi:hypothetical protein